MAGFDLDQCVFAMRLPRFCAHRTRLNDVNGDIFQAIHISRAEAESAYGLLALTQPDLNLVDWASSLPPKARFRQGKGLIGLRDGAGCIHSLFTYRVLRAQRREPTLQLCEYASLRLPGTSLIEALWRCANDLASELGLSSILIEMEPSGVCGRDRRVLEQRGFALDRVLMRGRAQPPALHMVKSGL